MALPEVPYDDTKGVIRNVGGRVVDESGKSLNGVFATGWIKRGPVGLIGHTKSDAMETIENLVADVANFEDPAEPELEQVLAGLKAKGVQFTDWAGWLKRNEHELALGEGFTGPVERERVKVVDRDEQVSIARASGL